MKTTPYPLLQALEGRGSACYLGAPLSYLLVEVRSGQLFLTGKTPLVEGQDTYLRDGMEYCYILNGPEAERLLTALSSTSDARPERILAQTFEFSRPDCPLKDFLDELAIPYEYHCWEGDEL